MSIDRASADQLAEPQLSGDRLAGADLAGDGVMIESSVAEIPTAERPAPERPALERPTAKRPDHSSEWLRHRAWATLPVLDVIRLARRHSRVVVLAAHPDDETLGAGGLMAELSDAGVEVRLVVVTDGEASHPHASAWRPEDLARVRREEIHDALQILAPGARLRLLGVPDGDVEAHTAMLCGGLAGILRPGDLVLAPSAQDGHPDHDALGRIAGEAARRSGAVVAHYAVWAWSWTAPETVPWERAVAVEPSLAALRRRDDALAVFRSQTHALGPGEGDAPILTADHLAHAGRIVELLFLGDPAPDLPERQMPDLAERRQPFETLFAEQPDPWGLRESFYEHRKRELTMACFGRPAYDRVLEIGCGNGALTRELAGRAAQVVAMDVSPVALELARAEAPENVDWLCAAAPEGLPEGPFDLIVIAEVGYYLRAVEWLECLRRARSMLSDGGEIVLVHWRHAVEHIPLDGPRVHEHARLALDLPRRLRYEDADLLLEVWGEPVSVHRDQPENQPGDQHPVPRA